MLQGMIEFREELARKGSSMLEAACRSALGYLFCFRCYVALKGQWHEIFNFGFFHESVSPKPLSIPSGPFRNFSKILGDIRSARCTTTSVVDIGGKFATGINNFAAGVVDTGGKFATGDLRISPRILEKI